MWARYPVLRWAAIVAAILILLALAVLAAFPFELAKGAIERRLSEGYGRPVRIGGLARMEPLSFAPSIVASDIRIAQPHWAGPGEMLRIARLELRLPVLPVLLGKVRPEDVRIAGMEAELRRARDGRENWRSGPRKAEEDGKGDGRPPMLVAISGSRVAYHDLKRDRSFEAAIGLDAKGFALRGTGLVKGTPVTLDVRGAPVRPGRWPFRARIAGPAIDMDFRGTTDRPFGFGHLDAAVTARADNLTLIDAIIEAGLPATQPVRLTAQVRRDRPDWNVTALKGMVGRSDIAGEATIRKRDGRHRIEGRLSARRFDFGDLADARGRAIAAAKRARFGQRLFPDTAIDLDNVAKTDGVLKLHVGRLLWPGPSPLRSLDGTLKVDHSRLEFADVRIGLTRGVMRGRVVVDQRNGRTVPLLTLDLRAEGAGLADFVPGAGMDAPMRARMRLTGPGRTVRAAVARSTGRIAVVAQNGVLPGKAASLLGQDLGGLLKGKDEQAQLRCLIVGFAVTRGQAKADPILIDTSRAVTRAEGGIDLNDERIALTVHGVPKKDVALRIDEGFGLGGTVKAPKLDLPKKGAVGTVLGAIGNIFDGKDRPVAEDQDCTMLAARALRDR